MNRIKRFDVLTEGSNTYFNQGKGLPIAMDACNVDWDPDSYIEDGKSIVKSKASNQTAKAFTSATNIVSLLVAIKQDLDNLYNTTVKLSPANPDNENDVTIITAGTIEKFNNLLKCFEINDEGVLTIKGAVSGLTFADAQKNEEEYLLTGTNLGGKSILTSEDVANNATYDDNTILTSGAVNAMIENRISKDGIMEMVSSVITNLMFNSEEFVLDEKTAWQVFQERVNSNSSTQG